MLPYEVPSRRVASFARLVRELSLDAPARSVLDELLRMGVAQLLPDGRVALLEPALIPKHDPEAKLELLASDPAEVFATIAHNVEQPDEPWLQRKVVYDNIGSQALPALRSAARQLGAEFIRRANALLAEQDRDRRADAAGGDRSRVALGVYYFEAKKEGGTGTGLLHQPLPPPEGRSPGPSLRRRRPTAHRRSRKRPR
jgi:hypothetical protein